MKGGSKDVDKGGKELKGITTCLELKIMNTLESAQGVWTRQQGDQKSTIDNMIMEDKEKEIR